MQELVSPDLPTMYHRALDPMCHGNGLNRQGDTPVGDINPNGLVQYRDEHPKRPDRPLLETLSLEDSPKEIGYSVKKFIQSLPLEQQISNPTYHTSERAMSEVSCLQWPRCASLNPSPNIFMSYRS